MSALPQDRPRAVDHYENFPVASWLCPPRLRPPIGAIYWFARTADDLADEGDTPASQRIADLAGYRADLFACFSGQPDSGRWPRVFPPLRQAIADFALPREPLDHLLDAFMQDVRMSRDGAVHVDRDSLLAYCRLSANPVGRLLLHLYGVREAEALRQSDAICSALQLVNFWQDVGVDLARGRYYLPAADCARHGIDPRHPDAAAFPRLLRELCEWTQGLMQAGAPLVHRVPGRAGWELRLVVQGGLRILEKIAAHGHDTRAWRPTVGAADAPRLLWRAARM